MKGQIHRWKTDKHYTLIRASYDGKIATEPSCCCECFLFEDDFERDNSTDLGANWHEVVGDWGIQAITDTELTTHKRLVEKYDTSSGTAGALVICTQAVPARSEGEMLVSIEVPSYGLANGDTYHIYPACVDEHTVGPVRMTFVWDATIRWWTTYIYLGGVEQDHYAMPAIGTPHEFILNACVDLGLGGAKAWVAPLVNQYAAWAIPINPGTGRYAGIGHDNPGHLNQFDNFHLEELRTDDVLCESCFCQCENTAVPLNLLGTIACATGRAACAGFAGQTFPITFYKDSRPQIVTWRGGFTVTEVGNEILEWELRCSATGDVTGFNLRWVQCGRVGHNCSTIAPGCLDGPWNALAASACGVSSCDPLQLVFGPFYLNFSFECDICYIKNDPNPVACMGATPPDACIGTFYIIVTESP